jgi:hypothetical protein
MLRRLSILTPEGILAQKMQLSKSAKPMRFGEAEQPGASAHTTYRPDIDGIRALSIWAMVSYHAFPDLVPGGFVGVDVFFCHIGLSHHRHNPR